MIWGWVRAEIVTALVCSVPPLMLVTAVVAWVAWRRRHVDRGVDLRGVDPASTVQLPAVQAPPPGRKRPRRDGGRTPLAQVIRHTCAQIEAMRRG